MAKSAALKKEDNMFQAGELVVYGSTGVCRVEDFAGLDGPGEDRGKRYYLLKPLWQDGVIYAPMDSEKVPMRPVISRTEAEALIDELLTLDNPYNCPHGRPTIIAMTKAEMERKFKRIVN